MAMTFEEFVKGIDRVGELEKILSNNSHQDPVEREELSAEFVSLFSRCMNMGMAVLKSGNLTPKNREVMLKYMGKLNLALPTYEAQIKLRTKNAVESNRAKDDEEPKMGRAA